MNLSTSSGIYHKKKARIYQRAILIPPQLILIYNPDGRRTSTWRRSQLVGRRGLQGEKWWLKGRRIRRGVLLSSWTLVRRNMEFIVPMVVLVEEIRDVLSQKD
jgi:hypothetical protein